MLRVRQSGPVTARSRRPNWSVAVPPEAAPARTWWRRAHRATVRPVGAATADSARTAAPRRELPGKRIRCHTRFRAPRRPGSSRRVSCHQGDMPRHARWRGEGPECRGRDCHRSADSCLTRTWPCFTAGVGYWAPHGTRHPRWRRRPGRYRRRHQLGDRRGDTAGSSPSFSCTRRAGCCREWPPTWGSSGRNWRTRAAPPWTSPSRRFAIPSLMLGQA